MTHTIIVLEGGLTGRVENPFADLEDRKDFAANNPPRPLTK